MEASRYNRYKCKLVIANTLFTLFLICGYQNLSAQQSNSDIMELDKIITKESTLPGFIDENLSDFSMSKMEKLKVRYPLIFNKVNKKLVEPGKACMLFGIPINDIYAFRMGGESFCLYLLLDIDAGRLGHIVDSLGMPQNVTAEDYEARDFDFLAWHPPGIDILLYEYRWGAVQEPGKAKSIIEVTNMRPNDILCTEPIF